MIPSTTTKALTSPIFLALSLGAVLLTSAGAQTEERQVWCPQGSLYLLPLGRGAEVELEGGQRVRIPLPAKGDVHSLVAVGDGFLVAGTVLHEEGRRELRLWRGDRRQAVSWPAPPGQRATLRDQPVLLSRGGELAGMAWLEGDTQDRLAMMAAPWNGERWGRPERVSPIGPDSQLAPSGVVLADGSWLLAWSLVDGDDEIVWARRKDGVWSQPRFVSTDNQVPDVRPALAATTRGAVLAWSRFDGETYRVMLARFDGAAFVDQRMVSAKGSLAPSFVDGPHGPRLLFRSGPTRGWAVAELDLRGRLVRLSEIETGARTARPRIVEGPAGELAMRFADETEPRMLHRP